MSDQFIVRIDIWPGSFKIAHPVVWRGKFPLKILLTYLVSFWRAEPIDEENPWNKVAEDMLPYLCQ